MAGRCLCRLFYCLGLYYLAAHPMRPEIVLGAPGAGKTTALLALVEEELGRGVPPDRVGYLSFTRQATEVARERACSKFNLTPAQLPWFRTIHSLCFYALGMNSSDVFQGDKLIEFGDWLGVKVTGRMASEEGDSWGFLAGDRCLFLDNLARVRGIPLRQAYDLDSDGLQWAMVERVSRGLREYKAAKGLKDYTDMLQMFVESDWHARLEVLFVDEAQDLSSLQWAVIRKMTTGVRRLVVAGDDDQAIYRWSGADVDTFVRLEGEVRVLEQSWRVPAAVQALSAEVISRVSVRREKVWRARPEAGEVRRVAALWDADIAGPSVLVLARNVAFLREVEDQLRRTGVYYALRGAASVKPSLVSAVMTWEALRKGEAAPASAVRKVYDNMSSGKGVSRGFKTLPGFGDEDMVTLDTLKASGGLQTDRIWHEAFDRVAEADGLYLLRCLQHGEKIRQPPRIRLSTIHGAKGGEADHVVLLRDYAVRTEQQARWAPEDEARTWYVAVTRAREKLTIVAPQTRRAYNL